MTIGNNTTLGDTGPMQPAPPMPGTQMESGFDARKLCDIAGALISEWIEEDKDLDENRTLRKLDFTAEELQKTGLIPDPSDTFIGFRVIDENISREIPVFLKYFASSARQLVFCPLDTPSWFPVDMVETAYTKYVRYQHWIVPHYQAYDCAAVHGRGVTETLADDTKACGLASEFVPVKNFLFPLECRRDIQIAPMVIRKYEWNVQEFRDNAKGYQFDTLAVDAVLANTSEKDEIKTIHCVYKLFFRINGVVNCAWYHSKAPDKLLKRPYVHVGGKFDINGRPVPMTTYPFNVLYYRITEDDKIRETMGRADLDKFNQEGQCRLGTSFVNGVARACNVYPSVEGNPGSDGGRMEATVPLKPGLILERQIKFNVVPYPDPIVPQAINMLAARNSQSTGQVDYTAKNRQDSRKTAKEIEAAEQQAMELSGISLFALSQYSLAVYAYYWDVMQFNAQNNPRSTFLIEAGDYRDMLLKVRYNLLPAGDIDFVERMQKIETMLRYWPIYSQTPAAQAYLRLLTKAVFPNDSEELIKAIDSPPPGDPRVGIGQGLIEILAKVPREQLLQLFPKESQQQINQILDEAINTFRNGNQQQSPGQSGVPSGGQQNQGPVRQGGGAPPQPRQSGNPQ